MGNYDALNAAFENADGRFDLRPHAAGREMLLRLQSPQLMSIDPIEFLLMGFP